MIGAGHHSTRATAALQKLVEIDPAFGSLSLWCMHRDATPELRGIFVRALKGGGHEAIPVMDDIAPAYTDGRTIFYGREFEDWTRDEQVGVCAHEILHIAFRHVQRGKALHDRLGSRYLPRLFNIATDALINETLIQAEFSLPKEGVRLAKLPDTFKGRRSVADFLAKWDAEALYMALLDTLDAGGEDGAAMAVLLGATPADIGMIGPLPEDSQIEDVEWEQRIDRAFSAGRMAGRGIGTVGHQLADLPRSRTPWERILRHLLGKAVSEIPVQSYERPTRRWLALDADARRSGMPGPAYQPGLRKTMDRPRVAVCVDVSGSIPPALIDRFVAEIVRIGRRTGAVLHLVVFDHGIQLSQALDSQSFEAELKKIGFERGGGTSFSEPIDEALAHDPSAIVVLTDLHGPFGDAPRRTPVIWVSADRDPPCPPFGRLISMVG